MRHRLSLAVIGTLCAFFSAAQLTAQLVVNARAGMITYAEGTASILTSKRDTHGRMFQLFDEETLDSKTGLAEMQLSAGAAIRVGKQSQVRMIRSALEDTEVELVSGAAIVEVNRVIPLSRLRIRVRDCQIEVVAKGVYRFDAMAAMAAMPARLRVYGGDALVECGPKAVAVKTGKMMDIGTHAETSFDKRDWDRFHEWAATRSFQLFIYSAESRRRPSQWRRDVGGAYRSDAYALDVRQSFTGALTVIPRQR